MYKMEKTIRQISRLRLGRSLWKLFASLAVILTLGVTPVLAEETTAELDPEARAILMEMAEFISKAPAFSVTLRSAYDAIQEDGQYIEFGERRHVLLQRPDRLRVESERSDGEHNLVLFDGKKITGFKADDNIFAQVEKPGTIDEALIYLVRDLQFKLPLARMLHTGFAQQLEKMITAVSYVEEDVLFDVVTDHLAVRAENIDMQLWVAQGDEPLPRRIVITYMNAPGQPQFRGDFTDWSLAPKVAADSFTFTPPADAEQVPVIARVREKGSIPAQKGGE
jgi:hypothetical protein